MTVRVLVADDQDLVRTGLSMILDAQPDIEVVGQAADGHAAVELARRLHPDVCLVDIRMPGLDGIEVTELLAGRGVPDPIAVLLRREAGYGPQQFRASDLVADLLADIAPLPIEEASQSHDIGGHLYHSLQH